MRTTFYIIPLFLTIGLFGQEKITNKSGSEYQFTKIKELEATAVENQNRTGTCWSFSSLSFFESELIRMNKGSLNLSEMFIVRNAYIGKAINYLRMYGTFNFGQGGAFHDIPWVIKRYGIVPESEYKGLNYGSETHLHEELESMLHAMVKELAKKPQGGKLTANWLKTILSRPVDQMRFTTLPSPMSSFNNTRKLLSSI